MTATVDPAVDPSVIRDARREQLRAGAVVVAALAVLGALLGLVWALWSPARPPGVQLPAGTVQINESESFAAGDMRFAIITGVVGLVAGLALWFRRETRGPAMGAALILGGLAGAGLTELVGNLVGGGTNDGPPQTAIPHLPLSLHLHGLYLFEALLAVLVYSMLVAFAVDDDLGRPDPVRDGFRPPPPGLGLVQPQYLLQYGRTDGDGPGFPQQGQFPPQDPGQRA